MVKGLSRIRFRQVGTDVGKWGRYDLGPAFASPKASMMSTRQTKEV